MIYCRKHKWEGGECTVCGMAQCSATTTMKKRCLYAVISKNQWREEIWLEMDPKKCIQHQPPNKNEWVKL